MKLEMPGIISCYSKCSLAIRLLYKGHVNKSSTNNSSIIAWLTVANSKCDVYLIFWRTYDFVFVKSSLFQQQRVVLKGDGGGYCLLVKYASFQVRLCISLDHQPMVLDHTKVTLICALLFHQTHG